MSMNSELAKSRERTKTKNQTIYNGPPAYLLDPNRIEPSQADAIANSSKVFPDENDNFDLNTKVSSRPLRRN